jgi:GNAT superfamily N-acetyltransferase
MVDKGIGTHHMATVSMRNAVFEDAAALADLSTTLGYPAATKDVQERLLPIMTSEDNCVLVVCTGDGSVVAWVHVFLTLRVESDKFAEIGGLVVAEGQRGQGIGGRLMAAAEHWAIGHGVYRMRVRSRSSRSAAHGFYRDLGFTRIKEQEVFEKTLTKAEKES